MRKQTLLLMLLVMPAVLLIGSAHARKIASQEDTTEFKNRIDRYWAAWCTLHVDNVAPFYARDADLVIFDVAPLKYQGWPAYRAGVQKRFLDPTARLQVTSNRDLKVTRHDKIAWTTGTFHLLITPKEGDPQETDIRHTAIWEQRGGNWLIIHEHTSIPAPD